MLAVGLLLGAALMAPVAFAVGLFCGIDRNVHHERLDVRPALRRSVRR